MCFFWGIGNVSKWSYTGLKKLRTFTLSQANPNANSGDTVVFESMKRKYGNRYPSQAELYAPRTGQIIIYNANGVIKR